MILHFSADDGRQGFDLSCLIFSLSFCDKSSWEFARATYQKSRFGRNTSTFFAENMTTYGSLFANHRDIVVDGNFMLCALPGGAGNWISFMDFRARKPSLHP